MNLRALGATARVQAVSCWVVFCHLSVDIIEAVSTGRQQKAAGKETPFLFSAGIGVFGSRGAAVTSGESGL